MGAPGRGNGGPAEILLTSMDADGTMDGYDLELTRAVANAVQVPLIASGGGRAPAALRECVHRGPGRCRLGRYTFP